MTATSVKGLRQFLDPEQQRAWLEGEAMPPDADERTESLEQRFRYVDRFQKLLRRPQAEEALAILRLYAENCIPIPRTTERYYWSVSCLPSSNASSGPRTSATPSGERTASSSSRCVGPPRSAGSSPTRTRCAPSATSTSPT
jgi:hypothetical protein